MKRLKVQRCSFSQSDPKVNAIWEQRVYCLTAKDLFWMWSFTIVSKQPKNRSRLTSPTVMFEPERQEAEQAIEMAKVFLNFVLSVLPNELREHPIDANESISVAQASCLPVRYLSWKCKSGIHPESSSPS